VTLWTRILALLVVLAVPLGLAMASQALAARPGHPSVSVAPVQLSGSGAASVAPASPPTAAPPADPSAPRVVAPEPSGLEQDDDADDADEAEDTDSDVDDG
jgi:hypothetical protein